MSGSVKPWLAVRQPSLRGGVLQVMTGPGGALGATGKREARGQIGAVTAMHAVSTHAVSWTVRWLRHGRSTLAARRHIDLLRVSSALCRP